MDKLVHIHTCEMCNRMYRCYCDALVVGKDECEFKCESCREKEKTLSLLQEGNMI